MTSFSQLSISPNGEVIERGLTANCATWLSMDRCCDSFPKPISSTRSAVLDRTYLVDQDRLPKFFDKLDNHSRILLLIENPGHLPFLQQ